MTTKIEWTRHNTDAAGNPMSGETWNPTVGCDKVSTGCKHCYAIREAWKLMHNPNPAIAKKYAGTVHKTEGGQLNWTGKINFLDEYLLKPAIQKKATTYFVDSMSDLFHDNIPFEFIDKVMAVIALCPQHIFQVLTKRPQRMKEYFESRNADTTYIEEASELLALEHQELFYVQEKIKYEGKTEYWPTNELLPHLKEAGWYSGTMYVEDGQGDYDKEHEFMYEGDGMLRHLWLGTSVEDQRTAIERIPPLLQTSASVRFLSIEPLLEKIRFVASFYEKNDPKKHAGSIDLLSGCSTQTIDGKIYPVKLPKIDWVICGGESGPDARPIHPDWVRSIRDQCKAAGVSFFFKQWGAWAPPDEVDPSHDITVEPRFINNYICINRAGQTSKIANELSFEEGEHSCVMYRFGKKISGRELDGKEWNEVPDTKKNSNTVNQNVTKTT